MKNDTTLSVDQRIWDVVSALSAGQVMSYGMVAKRAGLDRAPRRVSPALNRAPKDLQLPWHRVVGANGRIAFPIDSVAYQTQRALLEEEGVVFKGKHIASTYLQTNGQKNDDLDAQLWGIDS